MNYTRTNEIVEISSIFSIDLAAVLFSREHAPSSNTDVFVNDIVDVSTDQRKYLHRLALPTLNWDIDPNGQIRQIHLPIENLTRDEFMDVLNKVIQSHLTVMCFKDKKEFEHIECLIENMRNSDSKDGIDLYIDLITQIYRISKIENVHVKNYRLHKTKILANALNKLLESICNSIKHFSNGIYKFQKGGAIEIKFDENTFFVKHIGVNDNQVYITDDEKNIFYENEFKDKAVSVKGPLETYLFSMIGELVHLPWYGDAYYRHEKDDVTINTEFISPVTVSSRTRVSCKFGGNGFRLVPSGYSLIEYDHKNVLDALASIYPEEGVQLCFEDLHDWLNMINNYPLCHQKGSKSQSRSGEFVRGHINEEYKKMINGISMKYKNSNYLNLGTRLVYYANGLRIIREYFHNKSPHYYNDSHLSKFLNLKSFEGIEIKKMGDKLFSSFIKLLRFFYKNKSSVELNDLQNEYENMSKKFLSNFQNEQLVKVVSKIEQVFIKVITRYYEIALFVTSAILKANIFTSFIMLGYDYMECIKKIVSMRQMKTLYFTPLFFEKSGI